MKKIILVFCFVVSAWSLFGRAVADDIANADERTRMSFAFGQVVGSDLRQTGLDFDYTAFTEGFKTSINGGESPFSMEEAIGIIQIAYQEAMQKKAEENRGIETAFLAENALKGTVITTESGLQYEALSEGGGERPGEADTVKVNYEGSLIDGTVFDSSFQRGETVEFPLNRVIPGWSEGIQLMTVGSVYRFYIPSALAYGEEGVGQIIPPFSTLIFRVELLEILPPEQDGTEEVQELTPER
jgi:FKBP-type peptidyl-prolyl cis-trans isomerase FkpA